MSLSTPRLVSLPTERGEVFVLAKAVFSAGDDYRNKGGSIVIYRVGAEAVRYSVRCKPNEVITRVIDALYANRRPDEKDPPKTEAEAPERKFFHDKWKAAGEA